MSKAASGRLTPLQFREIRPPQPIRSGDGPLVTVGWIVFRGVLHRLPDFFHFLSLWFRLVAVLKATEGMTGFDYLFGPYPLSFGIRVRWTDRAPEMRFYRDPTHARIADWALNCPLAVVMQLEHFRADTGEKLSGFYYYERESDIIGDGPAG